MVGNPKKIVINKEDLISDSPQRGQYPVVKEYPRVAAVGVGIPAGKKGSLSAGNIAQYVVAGLIGGVIAWLLSEIGWGEHRGIGANALVAMALWGSALAGTIGAAIAASEGIVTQSPERALKEGAIGLGVGFCGGLFGGFLGQLVYSVLGGGQNSSLVVQILARTIGWGFLGAFVGIAQGIAIASSRKTLNAAIGGLIGGITGGILFDPIGIIVGGGTISRLIAIPVMGTAIGYAISLVDEIGKTAWIHIVRGPMTGKQFILYNPETTVGSSPKNDIPIVKDGSIAPKHAVFRRTGNVTTIQNISSEPVLVNGSVIASRRLTNNDQIQVGNTVLLYSEKAVSGK